MFRSLAQVSITATARGTYAGGAGRGGIRLLWPDVACPDVCHACAPLHVGARSGRGAQSHCALAMRAVTHARSCRAPADGGDLRQVALDCGAFHLYDCNMENDGAAALVVVSTGPRTETKPAYVLAAVRAQAPAAATVQCARLPHVNFKTSAPRLHAMAGLGLRMSMSSVLQLTGGVLMSIVEHGFCPPERSTAFPPPTSSSG